MDFANLFFTLLSIIILIFIATYAFIKREISGSKEFGFMLSLMLVFSIASFAEQIAHDFDSKILYRNIAQIGNFFAPVAGLYAAFVFTDILRRKKKIVIGLISLIPLTALVLIFTNPSHNLVRSSTYLTECSAGTVLQVQSTALGKILVSFNFIFIIAAAIILFAAKVPSIVKKQNRIIATGMLLTATLLWLKMAGFIEIIDMSVFYVPGVLIIVYGLFSYQLFSVSPVAKDKVFEVINEGIVITSIDNQIIDMNPRAAQFFLSLYSEERVPGEEDISASITSENYSILSKSISEKFPQWHEALRLDKDSEVMLSVNASGIATYLSVRVNPLFNNNNKIGAVSLLRDITQDMLEKQNLAIRAHTDALTGLFNRQYLNAISRKLISHAHRKGTDIGLILIDIDHFKKLNDTHGHHAGDLVLKNMAHCILQNIREEDVACRYGGEEFLVLLPGSNKSNTFAKAEKIRKDFEKTPTLLQQQKIFSTLSAGVAAFPEDADKGNDVFNNADSALYESKENGRNRTTIFRT